MSGARMSALAILRGQIERIEPVEVGRMRVEYYDDGADANKQDGGNWISVKADSDLTATYPNLGGDPELQTKFLAKNAKDWRVVECDLVNGKFNNGGPRIPSEPANAGSEIWVTEDDILGGQDYYCLLHSVRILGTVYKKP